MNVPLLHRAIVVLFCAIGVAGCGRPPKTASGAKKVVAAKVTPGKDTTYIVGPLHGDGYVDYIAAINDTASKGVTVENNAAVPLMQACGLENLSDSYREEFLRRIGTDAPADVEFTTSPAKFAQAHGFWTPDNGDPLADPAEQLTKASSRPWSSDEFPILAKWLEESEQSLNVVAEASERPKFYEPLACGDNILTVANLPLTQVARKACRALVARAMFNLERAEREAAWRDLMACHRWARHVASAPCAVCSTVGLAMERMACRGDYSFARVVHEDARRSTLCREDLDRLAPLRSFAEKLDTDERLIFLDVLVASPRCGRAGFRVDDEPINDSLELWIADASNVDWNKVLRDANVWYDRGVAALRHPGHAARAAALNALDRDVKVLAQVPKERAKLAKLAVGLASNADRTSAVTAMLVCLQLPPFAVFEKFESEAAALLLLDRISFSLAIWRAKHGSYPVQLADLARELFREVPKDPFSDNDFRYILRNYDYALYSVGPNCRDEGGNSLSPDHPEADDISLESK